MFKGKRDKIQKAQEKIVQIKARKASIDSELKNAYFDYYQALGLSAKQIEVLIK